MAIDLAFVWAVLVAFAVLAYVVLDGFDLGIGILFPMSSKPEQRDVMINSVAPVWDGNETWLVLGGGGLFAAFPLAYAIVLPALYAPLIAMLLALVLRGVAFEFRFRTTRAKWLWDAGFCGASMLAALAQGIALGAFIQGFAVEGRAYAGGWFDWLTPFSILTGIAVVVGYALLGATWLIMKTEGALQDLCFRLTPPLATAVVGLIVIVSIWTPLLDPAIAARWFGWPNIVLVAPVPLLVAGAAVALYRAIEARREVLPFLLSQGLFLLSFVGLGISLYPYVVPRSITIWQAAAPPESLGFLLVGALILIPIIL
ncbi:MAG: cytochrome d ubiquinol oxidase subunit II, partial [Geminicoccaceae bacterium]